MSVVLRAPFMAVIARRTSLAMIVPVSPHLAEKNGVAIHREQLSSRIVFVVVLSFAKRGAIALGDGLHCFIGRSKDDQVPTTWAVGNGWICVQQKLSVLCKAIGSKSFQQ